VIATWGVESARTARLEFRAQYAEYLEACVISYEEFGKLRLSIYLDEEVDDFEFMDQIWAGETYNFTQWLRLKSDPKVLRSLALDFDDFLMEDAERVMKILQLPLRQCIPAPEIETVLGKPVETVRRSDRTIYEYVYQGPPKYDITCAVTDQDHLSYVVIMRP